MCGAAGVPRSSFTFQFELSPAEGQSGVVALVCILPPCLSFEFRWHEELILSLLMTITHKLLRYCLLIIVR